MSAQTASNSVRVTTICSSTSGMRVLKCKIFLGLWIGCLRWRSPFIVLNPLTGRNFNFYIFSEAFFGVKNNIQRRIEWYSINFFNLLDSLPPSNKRLSENFFLVQFAFYTHRNANYLPILFVITDHDRLSGSEPELELEPGSGLWYFQTIERDEDLDWKQRIGKKIFPEPYVRWIR